jgi:protein O-GlcNAc transferase
MRTSLESQNRTLRGRRLSNRGAQLLREGEPEKAVPLLLRAYALIPDDVPTAINLGAALVLRKRYQQAIPLLERARDLEPENEMVWINLGAAYLGNRVLAQDEAQRRAIAAFERALEINPVAPNVHYNLGLIHRDRGEIEQAIERFYQAMQANPSDQHARRAWQRLQYEVQDQE